MKTDARKNPPKGGKINIVLKYHSNIILKCSIERLKKLMEFEKDNLMNYIEDELEFYDKLKINK